MSLENVLIALKHSMNDTLSELDEPDLKDEQLRYFLTTHFAEKESRSGLVQVIRSPSLMYDYLNLTSDEKDEIHSFHLSKKDYLLGKDNELRGPIPLKSENVVQLIKKQRYTEQVLKAFEFYLEQRDRDDIGKRILFGSSYLQTNEDLNDKSTNLGKLLYQRAKRNFASEGGFNRVIELASEINPDILKYRTHREVVKVDSVPQLLRIFDFFLSNRSEGDVFKSNYLTNNEDVNREFDNLGTRLCANLRRIYSKRKEGFDRAVEQASEINPEIKRYSDKREVLKIDGPKQLIEFYDFFLENRTGKDKFSPHYIFTDERLKEKFGRSPKKLYANSRKWLSNEGGINCIVKLASEQRPEILQDWKYSESHALRSKSKVQIS